LLLRRAYTLPQKYTYALDPQRLAALEAPQGMLTVRLLAAEHVPRMDMLGKTDCFCKCGPRPGPGAPRRPPPAAAPRGGPHASGAGARDPERALEPRGDGCPA